MGGEPLMNRRFVELLNFLLDHKRHDLSISFVSNGTMIDTELVGLLKQFRNCNIEISLESISDNNHYIRQGSNTAQVMTNLQQLINLQDEKLQVLLRSVPQLLNINNYDQYLSWAWQQQIHVQGIPLIDPPYLQISVLPYKLRQTLIPQYQHLKQQFDSQPQIQGLYTGRNISTLAQSLSRECASMIDMLLAPEPDNVTDLRQQLAEWLMRWDGEFDLDARQFYPEYQEFLDDIGYV
jgi:pyruvate-formate lyase-activating enzyme